MWLTHRPVLHQHRTGCCFWNCKTSGTSHILQLAEPLSMTQSPSEQFGSKLVEMASCITGWHRGFGEAWMRLVQEPELIRWNRRRRAPHQPGSAWTEDLSVVRRKRCHPPASDRTLKPSSDAQSHRGFSDGGIIVVMTPTLTLSRLKQQKRQFSSKDQSDTSSGSQSGWERETDSNMLNQDSH